MPRAFEMSWDSAQSRWSNPYRGQRYTVACSILGMPATKEGSYQAANDWWRRKRAEIDGQQAAAHPHAAALAGLAHQLDYARRHGLHDEVVALAGQVDEVRAIPPDQPAVLLDEQTARRLDAARLLGITIPSDLDAHALTMLFGNGRIWADRLKREPTVPTDKTIGGLADRWVAGKFEEARKAVRSADGADNLRIALAHFVQFAGPSSVVDSITADVWHSWYVHCQGELAKRDTADNAGWSVDYASKCFSTARSFIRWLWEREVLASLPRNLDSGGVPLPEAREDYPDVRQ